MIKVFVKNLVKVFDGKFVQRKRCQSYTDYKIKVWSKCVSFDHTNLDLQVAIFQTHVLLFT